MQIHVFNSLQAAERSLCKIFLSQKLAKLVTVTLKMGGGGGGGGVAQTPGEEVLGSLRPFVAARSLLVWSVSV